MRAAGRCLSGRIRPSQGEATDLSGRSTSCGRRSPRPDSGLDGTRRIRETHFPRQPRHIDEADTSRRRDTAEFDERFERAAKRCSSTLTQRDDVERRDLDSAQRVRKHALDRRDPLRRLSHPARARRRRARLVRSRRAPTRTNRAWYPQPKSPTDLPAKDGTCRSEGARGEPDAEAVDRRMTRDVARRPAPDRISQRLTRIPCPLRLWRTRRSSTHALFVDELGHARARREPIVVEDDDATVREPRPDPFEHALRRS